MPVYVKNRLDTAYSGPAIAILGRPGPLDPNGQGNWYANVTSEIQGLTGAQYLTLQSEQMAGKILFAKDPTDIIETPGLEIRSTQEIYDTAMDPRGTTTTPTSPAYFDPAGQTVRSIIVDGALGSFELDFYGSIDAENVDPANKQYKYLGRFGESDPGLHEVPGQLLSNIRKYRWLKVEPIRGIKPKISFLASY